MIYINYRLSGLGWAECLVDVNGQEINTLASYLSDALKSLINATIKMLSGNSRSWAYFAGEPTGYTWKFSSIDQHRTRLRIVYNGFDEDSNDDNENIYPSLLDVEINKYEFAESLDRALSNLLRNYGLDGYQEQWAEYPFPLTRYYRLKELLKKTWHYQLAVESGPDQSSAEAIANYLYQLPYLKSIPLSLKLKQDPEHNWWCVVTCERLPIEIINNDEKNQRMTEIGFLFYNSLYHAPDFRYALVGIDVAEFRTYSQLLREDFAQLINDESVIIPERIFRGLVISEKVSATVGSSELFLPFKDKYLWRPYKGEHCYKIDTSIPDQLGMHFHVCAPMSLIDSALKDLAVLFVHRINHYRELIDEGKRYNQVYDLLKEVIDFYRKIYQNQFNNLDSSDRKLVQDYFYQELVRLCDGDATKLGQNYPVRVIKE